MSGQTYFSVITALQFGGEIPIYEYIHDYITSPQSVALCSMRSNIVEFKHRITQSINSQIIGYE